MSELSHLTIWTGTLVSLTEKSPDNPYHRVSTLVELDVVGCFVGPDGPPEPPLPRAGIEYCLIPVSAMETVWDHFWDLGDE